MGLSLNAWEMGQAWHLKGQGVVPQKRKALMYDLLTWRKKIDLRFSLKDLYWINRLRR